MAALGRITAAAIALLFDSLNGVLGRSEELAMETSAQGFGVERPPYDIPSPVRRFSFKTRFWGISRLRACENSLANARSISG
jgi:hypothetical protein